MVRPLALVVGLALTNGLLWAFLVPPWQAPDEPKHFEYVRLIAESGRVPAFEAGADAHDLAIQLAIVESMLAHRFPWYGHGPGLARELLESPAPIAPAGPAAPSGLAGPAAPSEPPVSAEPTAAATHASAPPPVEHLLTVGELPTLRQIWEFGAGTALYRSSPAYYTLAAAIQPDSLIAGLYIARLLGVFLGLGVVLLTAVAARTLFPDDEFVQVGAPAFVALLPMFQHLQASVNSDGLANLAAAFVLLMAVRTVVRGPRAVTLALLGVSAVVALLVKRTTIFALPVAAGAVALAVLPRRRIAVAVGGLAAGAFVAIAWLTAGGWERIPEAQRWTLLRYFFNEPDQPARIAAYLSAPESWPILVEHAVSMTRDFWGSFGWQVVRFPPPIYWLFALAVAAAVAGSVKRMTDGRTAPAERLAFALLTSAPVLVLATATAFFVSYQFLPYAPAPQARYLMAAVLAIAVVLVGGWGAFVPRDRRRHAAAALVGSLLVYNAVSLFGYVVPFFYR